MVSSEDLESLRQAAQRFAERFADKVDEMILDSVQFAIVPDDIAQHFESEMREKLAVEMLRDIPADATPALRVLVGEQARLIRERHVL